MAVWLPFDTGETRRREESPGSIRTRCRVTPGGGNPRESATEMKPPNNAKQCYGKDEKVR